MKEYLKIVVSGDVDSGKSTLIGRFLNEFGSLNQGVVEDIKRTCLAQGADFEFAYLLDSFEEERKGQLTIDTTQVFCKNKKGQGFVFIDVPGHQELLKNMLCGASDAEAAILVLDARKPVEEQTRRHAFILKFLGIGRVVVAVNKMDSVDFSRDVFEKAKNCISGVTRNIGIAPECFVPIAAKSGDNLCLKSARMPWYKGAHLLGVLSLLRRDEKTGSEFRFPVQDVYSLGAESVAVGEVVSGSVKKNDKVRVLPLERDCRVKKIMVFNRNKNSAKAPENIGLVLNEMAGLARGSIVCADKTLSAEKEISARIFCSYALPWAGGLSFRCVTQDVPCRIKEIKGVWGSADLEPKPGKTGLDAADVAEVVIESLEPMVVERFSKDSRLGRFVLKNMSDEICAVGRVI